MVSFKDLEKRRKKRIENGKVVINNEKSRF